MTRPGPLFKALAVASSALLFAGHVAYRAGAFDRLMTPEPAGQPDPAPAALTDAPPAAPDPAVQAADANFLSTSKSIMFVVPPGGAKDKAKPPAFLPGSKSMAPLLPPAAPKDTPPAQTPPPSPPKNGPTP